MSEVPLYLPEAEEASTSGTVMHIHLGRAQYKLVNAPVLTADVTFLPWSTLGAIEPISKCHPGEYSSGKRILPRALEPLASFLKDRLQFPSGNRVEDECSFGWNRWAFSCTCPRPRRPVMHIHLGRAQYKLVNAPVLTADVTFLLWSTLGAIDPFFLLFFFTIVSGPRRSLSLKLGDTRVYEPQIRAIF